MIGKMVGKPLGWYPLKKSTHMRSALDPGTCPDSRDDSGGVFSTFPQKRFSGRKFWIQSSAEVSFARKLASLRILQMSWGVKLTPFFEAKKGVSLTEFLPQKKSGEQ